MPRIIVALIFLLLPAVAGAQTGLVRAENYLTMRTQPKVKAAVVDKLLPFQPVKILDRKDNWAKVKTVKLDPALGKEGWVVAAYVSDTGFATVDRDKLSVRQGPGTSYPVVLIYNKTFPVFVRDVAPNGWVLVLDADGDDGWVPPSGLALKPRYVVTRTAQSNIRTGGGKDYEKYPIAFVAEKGVYLQVVEEKDGWLHVRHEGGQEGWISSKLVFGWNDEEKPKPKSEPSAKSKKSEAAKSEKSSASSKKSEAAAKSSSKAKSTTGNAGSKSGTKSTPKATARKKTQ